MLLHDCTTALLHDALVHVASRRLAFAMDNALALLHTALLHDASVHVASRRLAFAMDVAVCMLHDAM
jgi:hypothetical protein